MEQRADGRGACAFRSVVSEMGLQLAAGIGVQDAATRTEGFFAACANLFEIKRN